MAGHRVKLTSGETRWNRVPGKTSRKGVRNPIQQQVMCELYCASAFINNSLQCPPNLARERIFGILRHCKNRRPIVGELGEEEEEVLITENGEMCK